MSRLISAALIVLLLALQALPVQAAANDSKVTVYDSTAGVTKVVCYSAISPCTITLTAGHYYSITLQEHLTNAPYKVGTLDVSAASLPGWSSRTHYESWDGVHCDLTGFNYSDNGNVSWRSNFQSRKLGVVQPFDCVYYQGMAGVASSLADGNFRGAISRHNGTGGSTTVFFSTP